ncbi:Vacuolar protein sorting-associated protein 35, partial [Rhizopus stolonifer]
PVRGLFLLHYLGGMTRDFLPHNHDIEATIGFFLMNFVEMNKLWVRMQHVGHSRDKAKRESERKQLGTLVGTNLVRLSQLDIDLALYQTHILPGMLNEIVSCGDVMAQTYLMDVVIQIFPDEFHMDTLTPFLATTAQLHFNVDVKVIIMALLDRLASYAQHTTVKALFELFWDEIMQLVKTRQLPVQDQTSLFLSLANFSVHSYPDRLDYMDKILQFTHECTHHVQHSKLSDTHVLQLLLLPTKTWDVLTLISLKYYQPLLAIQSYGTRRTVALSILDTILTQERRIDQPEQVYQILEICHVLIKDNGFSQQLYPSEQQDDRDEHGWIARLVHLFYSDDQDVQFLLLSAARQQLEKDTGERIKAIFPSLIISCFKLAKRYHTHHVNPDKQMSTLYTFIHQIIMTLHRQSDASSASVQFSLMAGQNAFACGYTDVALDFYWMALRIYEKSVSHSRAQFDAIVYCIGSLLCSMHDDALVTKITLLGTKLLKRPDQSRAIYLSSHLWQHGRIAPQHVTELIELISSRMKYLSAPDQHPTTPSSSSLFEVNQDYIQRQLDQVKQLCRDRGVL